jgi:hypothetical protein
MTDAEDVNAIFEKCGLQMPKHIKIFFENWDIEASGLLPKSTLLVKKNFKT